MPIHPFTPPKGRLDTMDITSSKLRNVLGDPETRRVAIYVSERCSLGSDRYPLFVDLAAFTNSSLGHLGWKAFAETLPQRIDRLEEAGLLGPAIWVFLKPLLRWVAISSLTRRRWGTGHLASY